MRDSKRDTDVLNSLLDSVGEGEGGMMWENGIEICKSFKSPLGQIIFFFVVQISYSSNNVLIHIYFLNLNLFILIGG